MNDTPKAWPVPTPDQTPSPALEAWMRRNRARRAVTVARDRLNATARHRASRILIDCAVLVQLVELADETAREEAEPAHAAMLHAIRGSGAA
jgi:hypothetical protein